MIREHLGNFTNTSNELKDQCLERKFTKVMTEFSKMT